MIGVQLTYLKQGSSIGTYSKGLFRARNKADILRHCDENEMIIVCWIDLNAEEVKEWDNYLENKR